MIESPLLPNIASYVDGRWTSSDAGRALAVTNPATGEHLADVPDMGEAETAAAVEAAALAADSPGDVGVRKQWLMQIHDALLADRDDLARLITLENGKPIGEAAAEVSYAAGFFSVTADHLEHLKPRTLEQHPRDCTWTVHHRPAGVVALITPWNFPLAMLAKKLAPAVGTGCSAVIKPASNTPLSVIALFTLLDRMGLPRGLLNLVIGRSGPIGKVFCSHEAVRIVSFTGSTDVGSQLIAQTAPHIKRLAMELGGNAPFIVFDDADADHAADELMGNKFRGSGQTCVCANRVLVQQEIVERFTEAVVTRVKKLRVGNGMDDTTDIGPLINRNGFDKVAAHLRDALDRGAVRVVGDEPRRPEHDWGAFFPPTVLTNVTPDMRVCGEETFGPIVPITPFDSEAGAVTLANHTQAGLAAYVFTADEQRTQGIAAQLHFGHVGVNTGTGPAPEAPFGGMKQSGFGREGGIEGLLEFCELQTVAQSDS